MDTKDLKIRTEKLKSDINALVIAYIEETNITPDVFQGVARVNLPIDGRIEKIIYEIDLGVRL